MSKASPCNQRRLRVRLFKRARAHFRQLFLAGPQRLSQEDAEVFQVVFPELFVGLMPASNPFSGEGGSDPHYAMVPVSLDELDPPQAGGVFTSDYDAWRDRYNCTDCGDDMASGYFDPTALCDRHRP